MRLAKVTVEGFRSIAKPLELVVDPTITVVLAANDHGKTNLLEALSHLNEDSPFTEAELNWDCSDQSDRLPAVQAVFNLSDADRTTLVQSELKQRQLRVEAGETQPSKRPGAPTELRIDLFGVGKALTTYIPAGFNRQYFWSYIKSLLPIVELIQPQGLLADSVEASELEDNAHEFMRGIFYYAGIDALDCSDLFEQTDKTERRLDRASNRLNRTLRASWTQGSNLKFRLSHRGDAIELLLQDPAVNKQYVRASRRSSGFTHFFALKTILYARERERPANSRIYLFDEPGTFLHPSGQKDLMRVLENIGQAQQAIYTTHSIFMINRSYPTRHRLLLKDRQGTKIEQAIQRPLGYGVRRSRRLDGGRHPFCGPRAAV
ncbi:MAG TPA: AAA family ATPase [Chloroflexota bacterium]